MEEISPAVAITLGLVNSACENPGLTNMEITTLKLVTENASLLSDSALMTQNGSSWNASYNCVYPEESNELKIRKITDNNPESEEDQITRVDLLPVDSTSNLCVSLVADSDTSLPIAVEIEGTDNGQIVAKVISLEEGTIQQINSGSVQTIAANQDECSTIKESVVVAVQLPGESNSASKGGSVKSVFELDYVPLWGTVSICGHRPEMEDAVVAAPHFMKIPIKMFINDHGIAQTLSHLTSHFFGVYDGHGGSQVANYCRDRIHLALIEELKNVNYDGSTRQVQWEKVFISCFLKVDDEVGGKVSKGNHHDDDASEPLAAETVGSTAVVTVICSSHIIVSNCGDSRAVLYRGKEAIALSVDHKPNREDEYSRIEASGGKVIQWNGHRVFGVLAMSRSIGDRYLKPWIIPEPEVMIMPRARTDECLVLASDGLWDVMTNEEVCEVARKRILVWHKKNGNNTLLVGRGEGVDPAAQAAAEYLAALALQKGSKDNVSVIVVDLKAQRKFKNKT